MSEETWEIVAYPPDCDDRGDTLFDNDGEYHYCYFEIREIIRCDRSACPRAVENYSNKTEGEHREYHS